MILPGIAIWMTYWATWDCRNTNLWALCMWMWATINPLCMDFLQGWQRGTRPEYQRCIAVSYPLYREAFRENAVTSKIQLKIWKANTALTYCCFCRALEWVQRGSTSGPADANVAILLSLWWAAWDTASQCVRLHYNTDSTWRVWLPNAF